MTFYYSCPSPGQALHWVYDVDKLQGILTGVSEPEFMDQHHCPFYRVETGGHGPCGDQAVVQLQSLADCKGEVQFVGWLCEVQFVGVALIWYPPISCRLIILYSFISVSAVSLLIHPIGTVALTYSLTVMCWSFSLSSLSYESVLDQTVHSG